jgi:hypothetical protein
MTIFEEATPTASEKDTTPKPAAEANDPNKVHVATLRALDKITGRATQLTVQIDEMKTFGRLRIVVHACKASAPTEAPEAAAFLKIYEYLPEKNTDPLLHYSGWMFASSPTVGALTHPVYDVWVEACRFVDKSTLPHKDLAHKDPAHKDSGMKDQDESLDSPDQKPHLSHHETPPEPEEEEVLEENEPSED